MQKRLLYVTVAVVWALGSAAADAQTRTRSNDWCQEQNWGTDRARACEVRELTLPSSGSLTIDASPNGGISVEGAPRNDVHLLARIVATAASEERAKQILAGVRVQPSGDRIEAEGPTSLERPESWTVSYELSVPQQMSLSLKTTNGGLSIREVEGRIEFTTTNGGVRLTNVGGEVRGRTTNGGVDIDLDGATWRGEGLDVQTTNGGVRIAVPEHYSARLEAGTSNGGVNSDFPATISGRVSREIDAILGAGGPPIRVRTSNGGVRITKK